MKIAAVFFFILFCIILCLRIPELVILAFCIRDQFVVGALLDYSPILEHGDLITELTGGQPVGNINGGFVPGDFIKLAVNLGPKIWAAPFSAVDTGGKKR